MKAYQIIIRAWAIGWLLVSCGGNHPGPTRPTPSSIDENTPTDTVNIPKSEENLELMTMQELRILRSEPYARRGVLFNESDLRRYWRENTAWYDTLSRRRYHQVSVANESPYDDSRIAYLMAQLQQQNYIFTDCDTIANILNVVNMFQFAEITQQETMDQLATDNYATLPDTLLQLFEVYQRNDSLYIPNFVTADVMAQLSHVYEAYVLRTVEEKHLASMMAELCVALHGASVNQFGNAAKKEVKELAAFNAAYFAVAYNLLTGRSLKTPGDYQTAVEEELAYIEQQEAHRPALLELKNDFDYGVFRPSGHYTRSAALRRYFKALKWLQTAPWCSDNRIQLQRAALVAMALQTVRVKSGALAIDVYSRLSGALEWFGGQAAYGSVLDVALFLKKERVGNMAAALDNRFLTKLKTMIARKSLPTTVKFPAACGDGIYFLPQPAYVDEEVLQMMFDPSVDARRPFPKALDVLAAFGSKPAFDQLFLDNREDTLWTDYLGRMVKMTERMQRFEDWDASSYHKRLECMTAMQQKLPNAPVFARRRAWDRKTIMTSSALWVKMKHNPVLYGAIPDHVQPLQEISVTDSLPLPLTMGYVEPCLLFWTKLREWVELTDRTLVEYRLTTDTLTVCTARLHRYVALMEDAARRELNHERLPDETCRFIAHVGDSICRFTLSMITPEIDRWDWVAGDDRSAAISEKVFHRHVAGCPSNGTLYASVGNIDLLYVVVEIDGYLYLTKGAAFHYEESRQ